MNSPLIQLLIYLVIGTLGGLAAGLIRVSGSTMIGAMFAIILYRLFQQHAPDIPNGAVWFIQILLGIMVGAMFHVDMLQQMRAVALPMILSTIALVGAGVVAAVLLTKFGIMDTGTAYLATSPGALSSIIGIALEEKANPPVVACFHFFRLMFIVISVPFVLQALKWWLRH